MRMVLRLQILTICTLFALLCSVQGAYSGTIFQENFDSHSDWNADGSKDGVECTSPCSSAPEGWTNYRIMPGSGSWSNPPGSIQRLPGNLPDHTTGNGKAYIVYNESHPVDNWPGDAIISKTFDQDYSELYVRLWIRTQANWQTVSGAQSKFFRVLHYDKTGNIFQFFSAGNSCPLFVWDLAVRGSDTSYLTAYRCDPQSSNYYCTASGVPSYQLNDTFYYWPNGSKAPTASGMYADTKWHRLDYHFKMNDIGKNNGIMEWSYDGVLMESRVDVQWKSSGSSSSVGWNTFMVGGNSNNSFADKADQWYAIFITRRFGRRSR